MNLRYNSMAARFEAEFSTDFQGDLAAVKASGFRCTGPPSWVWHTAKIPALDKLRANKPPSGLSITNEAYNAYVRLSEIERKNAEVRAQAAPIIEEQKKAKKERKKKELKEQHYTTAVIPPKPGKDFDYIGAEDLPPMPPFEFKIPIHPHPGPWCVICTAPVYFYEKQEPTPMCIFCEKSLDSAVRV